MPFEPDQSRRAISTDPNIPHAGRAGRWMGAAALTVILSTAAATSAYSAGDEKASNDIVKNPQLTDTHVTIAVERSFITDHAVPFDAIDVDTVDGVVTITGVVNNLLEKERAARIARTLKGVRAVVNRIEVRPLNSLTSVQLRSSVGRALLENPSTDAYEIDIETTSGGVVLLTGTVDSGAERFLAEEMAKSVRGTTAVINEIEIKPAMVRPDEEVASDVAQRLRWDVLVDDGMIDVRVDNQIAYLSGTVGSAAEKREAEAKAWVPGVTAVDSTGLEVARWARDPDLRRNKYFERSDSETADAVMTAIRYEPIIDSKNVTATVIGNAVVLRGEVRSLGAKRAAGRVAGNIVGVRSVINHLKVVPHNDRSDTDIEKSLEAALKRDADLSSTDIDIDVSDGRVNLYGATDDSYSRQRAEALASQIEGVREVDNHLGISATARVEVIPNPYVDDFPPTRRYGAEQQPALFTATPDDLLEERIREELRWSPFVDSTAVRVRVNGGVATLDGRVETPRERDAAVTSAYEGGAAQVIDHISMEVSSPAS